LSINRHRFALAAVAIPALLLATAPALLADPKTSARPVHAASADDSGVLDIGRIRAMAKASPRALAAPAAGERVTAPFTPSECAATTGARCYGPVQINRAYGIDKLHRAGLDGRGRTVAIVIPFHNPDLHRDMATYSRQFGLPHARMEVIKYGAVPTADPANLGEAACAEEGTVDAQTVHSIAPRAKILVVETPPGPGGDILPPMMQAIGWIAEHRPEVDAISMSWGAYEDNALEAAQQAGENPNFVRLHAMRGGLKAAYAGRITLIASAGNTGATGWNLAGDALYGHRSVAWPSSDPLVTSVGGTRIHLDDHGRRTRPDEVWTAEGTVATGGGLSKAFPRPRHQNGVRDVVGKARGTSDIVLNASTQSREWHYSSRYNALGGQAPGWVRVAGTSIAAPKLAGLVAIANQAAHRKVGDIRPALYTTPAHRPAAFTT
jgi:subtilase family serine protease